MSCVLLALSVFLVGPPVVATGPNYTKEAEINVMNEMYVTIYGLSVGDWDNDGRTELLANYDYYAPHVVSGTPELVAYCFNETIGGYVEEGRIPGVSLLRQIGRTEPPVQLIISDIDGDGLNEIAFPGLLNGTQGIHVIEVHGSSWMEEMRISGDFHDIAVGDLDGDELVELAALQDGQLLVYELLDSSRYEVAWSTVVFANLLRIGNVDIDPFNELIVGTGDVDISVYGFDGGTYVLEGTGDAEDYLSMGLGVGDFDSDGEVEILRVGYHGSVVVYSWARNGWFVEESWDVDPPNDNPHYGIAGDLDGDSTEEIIVAYGNYAYAESFQVFSHQPSTGNYTLEWTSGTCPGWGAHLFVGDPDEDGQPELVTGSRSQGNVLVFSAPSPSIVGEFVLATVPAGLALMLFILRIVFVGADDNRQPRIDGQREGSSEFDLAIGSVPKKK